jgi:hypothetical protein
MAPTIRIDDQVFEALQKRAKPLVDSPNDVLRRVFNLNGASPISPSLSRKHPGIVIDDPVMLIRIARRYRPRMSDDALYDATRRAWRVGKRRETARFACAVFEGVVREVYEIDQWSKASPRKGETFLAGERWEFVGRPAEDAIRSKYLGGRVDSYLPHGAQNPIRYVNCPSSPA